MYFKKLLSVVGLLYAGSQLASVLAGDAVKRCEFQSVYSGSCSIVKDSCSPDERGKYFVVKDNVAVYSNDESGTIEGGILVQVNTSGDDDCSVVRSVGIFKSINNEGNEVNIAQKYDEGISFLDLSVADGCTKGGLLIEGNGGIASLCTYGDTNPDYSITYRPEVQYYLVHDETGLFTDGTDDVIVKINDSSITKFNLSGDRAGLYLIHGYAGELLVVNEYSAKKTLEQDKTYLVTEMGTKLVSPGGNKKNIVVKGTNGEYGVEKAVLEDNDYCITEESEVVERKYGYCTGCVTLKRCKYEKDDDMSTCGDMIIRSKRTKQVDKCNPSSPFNKNNCITGYYILDAENDIITNGETEGKLWHCNEINEETVDCEEVKDEDIPYGYLKNAYYDPAVVPYIWSGYKKESGNKQRSVKAIKFQDIIDLGDGCSDKTKGQLVKSENPLTNKYSYHLCIDPQSQPVTLDETNNGNSYFIGWDQNAYDQCSEDVTCINDGNLIFYQNVFAFGWFSEMSFNANYANSYFIVEVNGHNAIVPDDSVNYKKKYVYTNPELMIVYRDNTVEKEKICPNPLEFIKIEDENYQCDFFCKSFTKEVIE